MHATSRLYRDGLFLTETIERIVNLNDEDDASSINLGVLFEQDGRPQAKRSSTQKGKTPKNSARCLKCWRTCWSLYGYPFLGRPVSQNARLRSGQVRGPPSGRRGLVDSREIFYGKYHEDALGFDSDFRQRFTWCFNNKDSVAHSMCLKFARDDTKTCQMKFSWISSPSRWQKHQRNPLWHPSHTPQPPLTRRPVGHRSEGPDGTDSKSTGLPALAKE